MACIACGKPTPLIKRGGNLKRKGLPKKYCSDKCKNKACWRNWTRKYPFKANAHWNDRPYWVIAMKNIPQLCKICNSKEKLDVHHLKPKSFGGNDELSNLIIVCKMHHKEIHKKLNLYIGQLIDINPFYKSIFNL